MDPRSWPPALPYKISSQSDIGNCIKHIEKGPNLHATCIYRHLMNTNQLETLKNDFWDHENESRTKTFFISLSKTACKFASTTYKVLNSNLTVDRGLIYVHFKFQVNRSTGTLLKHNFKLHVFL